MSFLLLNRIVGFRLSMWSLSATVYWLGILMMGRVYLATLAGRSRPRVLVERVDGPGHLVVVLRALQCDPSMR